MKNENILNIDFMKSNNPIFTLWRIRMSAIVFIRSILSVSFLLISNKISENYSEYNTFLSLRGFIFLLNHQPKLPTSNYVDQFKSYFLYLPSFPAYSLLGENLLSIDMVNVLKRVTWIVLVLDGYPLNNGASLNSLSISGL